jgi:hypothetical protein
MLRSPLRSPIRAPSLWLNFTPAALGSDLLAWWDSSTGVALSGASVTSWTDKVGSLAPAQGTAASQPQYSATSFNGKPGISFDGTADHLTVSSVGSLPTGTAQLDMYAVVDQQATDTTARRLFGYGAGNDAQSCGLFRRITSSQSFLAAYASNGTSPFPTNAPGLFTGRTAGAGFVRADSVQSWQNGGYSAIVAVVPNVATVRTVIGTNTAMTLFHQGVIRDIIVTAPLNYGRREAMLNFIQSRVTG